jgi:hypothetical protein
MILIMIEFYHDSCIIFHVQLLVKNTITKIKTEVTMIFILFKLHRHSFFSLHSQGLLSKV